MFQLLYLYPFQSERKHQELFSRLKHTQFTPIHPSCGFGISLKDKVSPDGVNQLSPAHRQHSA